MTPKLKQLNETVGALKKEIRTHLDSEARQKMSASDRAADPKLKELEAKFDTAQADFDAEFRQAARESGNAVDLSKSERQDVEAFDIGRALRAQYGIGGERLEGNQKDIVTAGFAELRAAGVQDCGSGIVLPRAILRQRDLRSFRGSGALREQRDMTATGTTTTTGDQGGQLIATTIGGMMDAFYNADVMESMGITTFDGLTSNLNLPRFVRPSAPSHKAENAAADELSPTVATLSLTPCRLPASVDVSDQLLLQGPGVLLPFLNNSVVRELRSKQQISLLHGAGSGNEPTGLAGTTGINAVYAGGAAVNGTNADGAAPVWDDIINFETACADVNAEVGRSGYLFNSRLRGKLKRTLRTATYGDKMLWEGNDLNGYTPYVTNAVSRALSKGASSGILSGGFFSPNWGDLVRATFGGMALELASDTTGRKAGLRTIVGSIFWNGGAWRPASFAYGADFLTS